MISLTRLSGTPFVVNAELIRTIEETPDTTITLINGDHLLVRESMREVVLRCIAYGRHLRRFQPVADGDGVLPRERNAGPVTGGAPA